MTPACRIIREARAAGVELFPSPSGGMGYTGPGEAFTRLRPALIAHKQAIVGELVAERDRLVNWWSQPVEGWSRGKLTISNIATGATVTIDLRATPTDGACT